MLYIYVGGAVSERFRYASALIFDYILHIPYEILSDLPEDLQGTVCINYTGRRIKGMLNIPKTVFLEREDCEAISYAVGFAPDLLLFYDQNWGDAFLSFDIFSATFYIATEYYYYQASSFDSHGRYREDLHLLFTHGLQELPLIHMYCELLWDKLQKHLPKGYRKAQKLAGEITFDIDNPWKYHHKGLGISLGGGLKQMFKGDWGGFGERLAVVFGKKDPHDVFEDLFRLCSPDCTTFFFLIERKSVHDGRFTYRNRHLRALIREIHARGYSVGIHPSYTAAFNPAQLKREVEALSDIIGEQVTRSRQHFLRYRYPTTFRSLLASGIQSDYSLCSYSKLGYRTGLAVPYPWFDVLRNCTTDLMLHPTMVMDRTLHSYMDLSAEEAEKRVYAFMEQSKRLGLPFRILFHNDGFSESGEWRGWRSSLEKMLSHFRILQEE